MKAKLQFFSPPEEKDPYQFMDRLIRTARHMLGFGATIDSLREILLKNGATEEQAYLAYKAAQQLNKE